MPITEKAAERTRGIAEGYAYGGAHAFFAIFIYVLMLSAEHLFNVIYGNAVPRFMPFTFAFVSIGFIALVCLVLFISIFVNEAPAKTKKAVFKYEQSPVTINYEKYKSSLKYAKK